MISAPTGLTSRELEVQNTTHTYEIGANTYKLPKFVMKDTMANNAATDHF